MGNNCVCLKNTGSVWEIYTPAKTETHNLPTLDIYKNTEPNREFYKNNSTLNNFNPAEFEETLGQAENAEGKIVRAKAAAVAAASQEIRDSSTNNKSYEINKSFDHGITKDTKDYYEESPQLVQFPSKDDYLDYAMDLFDEVNKYRGNPELFVDLVRKYPNITVNKDYAKKAGFEIGWNQKLFELLNDFLIENSDGTLSLEFKNKINQTFNSNLLYHFEINAKELSIERNICEIISRYYSKHKEIFQTDYSIGALGIVKNKDFYRIVLLFA